MSRFAVTKDPTLQRSPTSQQRREIRPASSLRTREMTLILFSLHNGVASFAAAD